jgi:hypothetical protein
VTGSKTNGGHSLREKKEERRKKKEERRKKKEERRKKKEGIIKDL